MDNELRSLLQKASLMIVYTTVGILVWQLRSNLAYSQLAPSVFDSLERKYYFLQTHLGFYEQNHMAKIITFWNWVLLLMCVRSKVFGGVM